MDLEKNGWFRKEILKLKYKRNHYGLEVHMFLNLTKVNYLYF
jgi:hypothetical protein